jgi:hypothetical protein
MDGKHGCPSDFGHSTESVLDGTDGENDSQYVLIIRLIHIGSTNLNSKKNPNSAQDAINGNQSESWSPTRSSSSS